MQLHGVFSVTPQFIAQNGVELTGRLAGLLDHLARLYAMRGLDRERIAAEVTWPMTFGHDAKRDAL